MSRRGTAERTATVQAIDRCTARYLTAVSFDLFFNDYDAHGAFSDYLIAKLAQTVPYQVQMGTSHRDSGSRDYCWRSSPWRVRIIRIRRGCPSPRKLWRVRWGWPAARWPDGSPSRGEPGSSLRDQCYEYSSTGPRGNVAQLPPYQALLVVDMKDFSGNPGRDHTQLTKDIPGQRHAITITDLDFATMPLSFRGAYGGQLMSGAVVRAGTRDDLPRAAFGGICYRRRQRSHKPLFWYK